MDGPDLQTGHCSPPAREHGGMSSNCHCRRLLLPLDDGEFVNSCGIARSPLRLERAHQLSGGVAGQAADGAPP